MSLNCPDCGGVLAPERDEDARLLGFECENCGGFFDDPREGEDQ